MNNNTKAKRKLLTKKDRQAQANHGRQSKHAKVAWCGGQGTK